jgi:hypothetical protein
MVMELADEEARALYSEPSVREYLRERVQVELLDTSEAVEAYCYNLPRELGLGGANPAYATELSRLVEALQLDSAYVEEIAAFEQTTSGVVPGPDSEPRVIISDKSQEGRMRARKSDHDNGHVSTATGDQPPPRSL